MKKKAERRKDNRGSTLIEVVVSVLIVGLAFVPLLAGMNTALKASTQSEGMLNGDNVASKCIEVAKASGSIAGFKELMKESGVPESSITSTTNGFIITGLKEGISNVTVAASTPTPSSAPGVTPAPSTTPDPLASPTPAAGVSASGYTYKAVIEYTDNGTTTFNNPADYDSVSDIVGNRTYRVDFGPNLDYQVMRTFAEHVTDGGTYTPIDMMQYLEKKDYYISIDKVKSTDPDSDYEGQYRISGKIVYQMKEQESGVAIFDVSNIKELPLSPQYKDMVPDSILAFTSTAKDISELNNPASNTMSQSFYDYCKSLDTTDSIAEKSSYSVGASATETFHITSTVDSLTGIDDSKTNVYILPSGMELSKEYGDGSSASVKYSSSMPVVVSTASTHAATGKATLGFYCPVQNTVTANGTGDYTRINNLLSDAKSDEISKVYDVKVTVYDINGAVVSTMNSTVICSD